MGDSLGRPGRSAGKEMKTAGTRKRTGKEERGTSLLGGRPRESGPIYNSRQATTQAWSYLLYEKGGGTYETAGKTKGVRRRRRKRGMGQIQ